MKTKQDGVHPRRRRGPPCSERSCCRAASSPPVSTVTASTSTPGSLLAGREPHRGARGRPARSLDPGGSRGRRRRAGGGRLVRRAPAGGGHAEFGARHRPQRARVPVAHVRPSRPADRDLARLRGQGRPRAHLDGRDLAEPPQTPGIPYRVLSAATTSTSASRGPAEKWTLARLPSRSSSPRVVDRGPERGAGGTGSRTGVGAGCGYLEPRAVTSGSHSADATPAPRPGHDDG